MSRFHKVAVLGLDGVPFSLLQELFATGVMPRLAEVARSGSFMRMETSLPCVSSVAWTSFMTGKNPGGHGIFGFTDLAPGRIALRLPSFDDISSPVMWHVAQGKRSVVVNLPFTYPARPLPGLLISGFVAPILERSVYPPTLINWLKSTNYRTDVDAVKGRQDRQSFIRDLFETLTIHSEVILKLMSQERWDLFIGVITGTDRLHHFFFDAAYDPSHPLRDVFLDYYRRVDSFVGRYVERCDQATRLAVLSDHGFTQLKTQIYLNNILETMGCLHFSNPRPRLLEDIHPGSKAFAMDPSRIYLNSRDRIHGGSLSPGEAHTFRTKLKYDLESLKLSDVGIQGSEGLERPDDPLFEGVRMKEEIYDGKCLPWAPDLVVLPRPGYDIKAALHVRGPAMTDIFTGMHTHDDAFLILNDPAAEKRLPRPFITDVFGLVMEVLHPALTSA
ncbi:MAG: alkaline phosphatase family protein [Desulfomonile sp.]